MRAHTPTQCAQFNSVQVHFDKAPLEWPCLPISPHQLPPTENKREITYERLRRRSVISQPTDGSAAICMQGSAVACVRVIRVAEPSAEVDYNI